MEIRFRCLRCNQPMVAEESLSGQDIDCPACHNPRRVPNAVRLVSQPAIDQTEAAVPPPPPLPAPPAESVISATISPGAKANYRCTNPKCGALLSDDQLLLQQHGETSVRVCPLCRLGVARVVDAQTFWADLPAAFTYPTRGNGIWILLMGTPLLAVMDFAGKFGYLLGAVIAAVFVLGYFGMLLVDVIRISATDPDRTMEWPDFSGWDDILRGARQVGLTGLLIFAPAIVCALVGGGQFLGSGEMSEAGVVWMVAAIGLAALGALYYPMALLAVAMFDSINGSNPLLVVPAILRTLLQYLIVIALLGGLWFLRKVLWAALAMLPTGGMIAAYLPVEFLTFHSFIVSGRILGQLYRANAVRLGWFED